MNSLLGSTEVDDFLRNYQGSPADLALSQSPFDGVTTAELAQQLKGLKIARKKFPGLYSTQGIIYPPAINLEQTSSSATARHKASLFMGERLADLTGGLGIDSLAFSASFSNVVHIEKESDLSDLAAYNFGILGKENISCITGDFEKVLPEGNYDLIYLDPSRRHSQKGKVFKLTDYSPNPVEILPWLFQRTHRIMIKTSPLLDLSLGISQLKQVSEIHVVAVGNEVKEILWVLEPGLDGITLLTVNILGEDRDEYRGKWGERVHSATGVPSKYLYEPNAAILKAGLQDALAQSFGLLKLHPFTQLYTAEGHYQDFPGRVLRIEHYCAYGKQVYSELKKLEKAEVVSRNFPMTVQEIRKKFKIKDGGDHYWYFAGGIEDRRWAIKATRIK
jgi:hypothetical protein